MFINTGSVGFYLYSGCSCSYIIILVAFVYGYLHMWEEDGGGIFLVFLDFSGRKYLLISVL
jgi:hypothetical protein